MLIRIVVVAAMVAVVGVFSLKRVLFLTNLIRSGAKTSGSPPRPCTVPTSPVVEVRSAARWVF